VTSFLGFDILRPGLLAVAAAGPLVLTFGWLGLRARARARGRLVASAQMLRFLPRFSENRARLRVLLAASAALFLGLALVGPVRGYTLREVRRRGLDLVLCVDTSRSMLVQDLKPDRLTRARREVAGLLDKLKGDRAAILAFAGDVRDVAPLTHDRVTLKAFAATLNPEDNLRGGTDIGGVLEHALSLFDGRTGAHEAIVVITDGEDLEGQGLEVAKKAHERGIHVYLVGMGTPEGGKIPDGQHGFVKDDDGKEVVSKMDDRSLAAIAEATGGAYLAADASPIPLEELYEKRISKLEGRDLFAGKERIPHDRFQWPLVLAAACMLGEAGLRERRPAERKPAEVEGRRTADATGRTRGAA
jgi:Ca-activated chloride channel family protein